MEIDPLGPLTGDVLRRGGTYGKLSGLANFGYGATRRASQTASLGEPSNAFGAATLFDDHVDLLPKDKSSLLVFYCGGLTCPLSHKSAFKAEALGYDNIKVYAAGYPDWVSNGGLSGVTAKYVKKSLDKGKAVVIDARPPRKFKKGHVPGSISIPTTRFDQHKDSLPEDKATELIFYCGGYT